MYLKKENDVDVGKNIAHGFLRERLIIGIKKGVIIKEGITDEERLRKKILEDIKKGELTPLIN